MSTPILATKLYIPPPRATFVRRPRLLARLNAALAHKVTLISAPAGYGKTTLVSSWIADFGSFQDKLWILDFAANHKEKAAIQNRVAWLSLDKGDNDPTRFLLYLVAALQTVAPNLGAGVWAALQSPQPPPAEAILTALLNEIVTLPERFILVLDDYHLIEAKVVDQALTFLLEQLPPQMHLVIATREDPQLPLARLRARGQLTEVRAADLRFTPAETADFLNQAMGLRLPAAEIAALESRTEGWIAGLQLAALSMQGHQDAAAFIQSFTGSHRFVLDYLVEEVLQQQPAALQAFLLRTSILERLCGPLCDALFGTAAAAGSSLILEQLERANLFIIPLDNERRWYRYHHLFAELLRQRLQQRGQLAPGDGTKAVAADHIRASAWFEENGLELEAFHHAVAARDIDRAARLVEGNGMPLLFRGAVLPVFTWLESLPKAELDMRPSLWVIYASALLFVGQNTEVEKTLQAAEAALEGVTLDARMRDLVGHIASIRATMGVASDQIETIIAQSQRALDYLHPANLPVRTATIWTLGIARQLQGDRAAARAAYQQAQASSQAIGHIIIQIATVIGLGQIEEAENRLAQAAEKYRHAVTLAGDPPMLVACEAQLGLARVCYEWNDLVAAEQHGQQGRQLARQIELISTFGGCELLLARVQLAQGDAAGATARLAQAEQFARQHGFASLLPKVVAVQVRTLLHQNKLIAAAQMVQPHNLPITQAQLHLAQGDPVAALTGLAAYSGQVQDRPDERLKVLILQALAHDAHGETAQARQRLGDALVLAEPGGFIRLFADEGAPMARLLQRVKTEGGRMQEYVHKLLVAFGEQATVPPPSVISQPLVEPLSQREVEVLRLIAQGFSNQTIGEKLFLALDTVKGHNRRIFEKLQVQRRTEAVARARALGLL